MPESASRAFGQGGEQAECLPLPSILDSLGAKIRPGNLVMVAGAPGTGKSMWTEWLAAEMGLSTLYFSADMTRLDATSRLAAQLTGSTVDEVIDADGGAEAYYSAALDESAIEFCFDSSPRMDDIEDELSAWVEVNDAFPKVIVVDNLVNLEGSEVWEGQMVLLAELHTLARQTGSTVFVLHHASEANQKDPTLPASKKDIQNKVTHYPEVVLTVALDQVAEMFHVACVKNRSGKADATGKTYITLAADPARCSYSQVSPMADWWKENVS